MKQEGLKRQRRNSLNDDKISEDLLKEGNKNNIDDLLKRIKTSLLTLLYLDNPLVQGIGDADDVHEQLLGTEVYNGGCQFLGNSLISGSVKANVVAFLQNEAEYVVLQKCCGTNTLD
ncbi:hypothetical protein Tco_0087872 [Tanacetum coccineum]